MLFSPARVGMGTPGDPEPPPARSEVPAQKPSEAQR